VKSRHRGRRTTTTRRIEQQLGHESLLGLERDASLASVRPPSPVALLLRRPSDSRFAGHAAARSHG
jgi:hypothetical protein